MLSFQITLFFFYLFPLPHPNLFPLLTHSSSLLFACQALPTPLNPLQEPRPLHQYFLSVQPTKTFTNLDPHSHLPWPDNISLLPPSYLLSLLPGPVPCTVNSQSQKHVSRYHHPYKIYSKSFSERARTPNAE